MEDYIPSEEGIVFDVNYKDLLLTLLHEAHTISNVLSSHSEIISRAVSGEKIDKDALKDHAYKIFENAYLLSLWLNITEFEIDPSYFERQTLLSDASLYGKFKKASISFKQIARNKKIRMSVSGASTALLSLYPIIDILPYLILENALKYSPRDSDVSTEFVESSEFVEIMVSSIGPTLNPGEIDHIFEKGFRGREAAKLVKQGGGRGLALARYICDMHNADIMVEAGNEKFEFEGVPHSSFTVTMNFPRH